MDFDHLDVIEGDVFEVVEELPDNSFHAIVTDPPYGLAFMGKSWDDFEPREYQEWCEEWASELQRVLKPGGHLLAFSGNRTHHRMFCGVEDAGYTIRDTITWHYAGGFPKGLDVSKKIDDRLDAERTEGKRVWEGGERQGGDWSNPERRGEGTSEKVLYDEPATEEAERWDGWKTVLKPATEFVVLARKPLAEDTVVGNVLEYGTGALNIEETRVGMRKRYNPPTHANGDVYGDTTAGEVVAGVVEGRYPTNVIFDEQIARELDDEVGELAGGHWTGEKTKGYGSERQYDGPGSYSEGGGPSRYFYTSKASSSERNHDGDVENDHPTVKPMDLMEHLIKLVTAEDQWVLDPFSGSGTTMLAADKVGRNCVGIERESEYVEIIRDRVEAHTPDANSALEW